MPPNTHMTVQKRPVLFRLRTIGRRQHFSWKERQVGHAWSKLLNG